MSFPLYLPSSRPLSRSGHQAAPTVTSAATARPSAASPAAGRLTGVGEPVRRTPSDITLAVIFAELTAARAANQAERGTPRLGNAGGPRADRLLVSLETCVHALEDRNLPIPPTLRDELRLRRALYPTHRR
ncbi:hypothetical protein F1D05_19005 [Kribbella qitaiheensis]|uniref:Uncharacterized protein n=1 Tax=Kribbella qitaiheensis TaxID=1544730 RepID=A0A7G6X057_9ACTN|nr:hypothetical protein [Kribbella qitaiheensis]QNE19622.1 hypothetical protein F1D05_19005 [Kribbella qitaiheensis]